MLKLLPDIKLPVTSRQFEPIHEGVVQLNILDGGLSDRAQRALGIYLHVIDLYVKTKGAVDYRGKDGKRRLLEDAMTFCGEGNPVATRHGDIAAVHLAIDWHDTAVRSIENKLPLPSAKVSDLLNESMDLVELPKELDVRIGVLLDALGKKRNP